MTRPRVYTARKRRPAISIRAATYERLKQAAHAQGTTTGKLLQLLLADLPEVVL